MLCIRSLYPLPQTCIYCSCCVLLTLRCVDQALSLYRRRLLFVNRNKGVQMHKSGAIVRVCVHDARQATLKESALQHVPLTVAVLQASAHPQFQNSSQNNRHGRSCSGLMSRDHHPSLSAQRPPPLTPSYAPLSSVTWPLCPPAAVRLFCTDCCAGFFASIDRKAEGITFWNLAQGSLFHVPHAPGSHLLSLFP